MLRSLFQSQAYAAKAKALAGIQTPVTKTYLLYIVTFAILLAVVPAYSFLNPTFVLRFFIIFQCYSIVLGVIHIWQLGEKFGWQNKHSFIEKAEITVVIFLLATVASASIVYFSPLKPFFYLFPLALFGFVLPMLITSLFDFAITIQPKQYKSWFYPVREQMPDMDHLDFTNSYLLTWQIHKSTKDNLPTFMKFKAPPDKITFGDMFYMYVHEYNREHRESQIEYMDVNNQNYAWLFYIKPKRWWNVKRVIDPSLTIHQNKIDENSVVIPCRV